MVNHPNRGRGPYTAHVGGSRSIFAPTQFATISECRGHAESYGSLADWCEIRDAKDRVVASHRRDKNGGGYARFSAQGLTVNGIRRILPPRPHAQSLHPASERGPVGQSPICV